MEKIKILIVDDDPEIASSIKGMLNEAGYETRSVSDGEEGLRELKKFRPAVVLLDLMLPGSSGVKIAQVIKSLDEFKDTPLIAVSLKKDAVDKHVAAKSGIADYLEKPVDKEMLLAHLKEILGQNGSNGDTSPIK